MAEGFVRKGLRVAGIAAVVVILLLVVLRLAVPVVGVRVANSGLSDLLQTEVSIGKIELALLRGSVALKDLRIQQPAGYGEGDLLVVPGIRAKLKLGSLVNFPIRIEEVLLENPRVQIVRNREGELDVDALIEAVLSASDKAGEDGGSELQEEDALQGYPVVIEEASVRNLSVSYADFSYEERPYEAKLEHLTFVVTHLSLESSPGGDRPATEAGGSAGAGNGMNRGSVTLRNIRIDQPPGFGGDPLLTIPEVRLKVHVPSVFRPHLTVEEFSLKGPAIRLARNRSGRLNLEALLSQAIPQTAGASEGEEEIPSGQAEGETPLDWKVHLKRLSIEGLSFLYTDSSFQDEPLEMKVGDVNLQVAGLLLASEDGLAAHQRDKTPNGGSGEADHGAKGSLVVRDVRIDQPRGFSGDTFLSWPELKVGFIVDSVLNPSITIEQADLYEPRIHLALNKAHDRNVNVLISKTIPESPEKSQHEKAAPPAERSDQGPRIHLRKFAIHDLGLAYTDSSYEKKPLDVRLRKADLELTDLTYDPSRPRKKTLPATVRMTGRRVQKPFADAPIGLYAKIGTLGNDIPAVNGSIQLGGLELAPISHTLPPGTTQAIGGDALDLSVDLALAANVLDCNAKVMSIGGSSLSLHIGGTPAQPEVDTSNMLFLVMFRSGGAIGSVADKVGGAGVEVAGTAVGTVKVVGTGTAGMLGSAGGGLFHTAKGLATADVDKIAQGLKKTTVGTVKEGAGTATGTMGEVKDGAMGVGTAGIGMQQAKAWRGATQERWEKAWEKAQTRVNRMPYPLPK